MPISYQEFINKYPYFKSLDPDFKNRIDITTITIVGYLESNEYAITNEKMPNISKLYEISNRLSEEFINTIIINNETFSIRKQKRKYAKKCNKRPRKIKFEQIVIKTDIDENISLSMKLFSTGLFHITGANNISSVFWTFYRLFELMREIGYCNMTFKNIKKFNIEMINCKCYFPCMIDKYILYTDLMNDFKSDNIDKHVMSINYDPIRHSAVKIKIRKENALNDADVITVLVFAFGKMLITGAVDYAEIIYAYKVFYKYLLTHQKCILKYDEDIINKCLREETRVDGKIIYTDDGESYIAPYDTKDNEKEKESMKEKIKAKLLVCEDIDDVVELQQELNKEVKEKREKREKKDKKIKIVSKRRTYQKHTEKKAKKYFKMTDEMIDELLNDDGEVMKI